MIEVASLTKHIGEKLILRGIDLTIPKGEAVAILGPNGAGKSTILKIIGGLLKPTSGIIKIDGEDFKKNTFEIKRKIGFLSHNSFLYDHLSPMENLKFFGQLYGIEGSNKELMAAIDEVGLKPFMNEPVRSFSRGMVQRLAIARAILHEPDIIILDEPHTGLDLNAIQLLNEVISKMKEKGSTILMVTHDFSHAVVTCDRIVIVKQGKIVGDFENKDRSLEQLKQFYRRQVG